MKIRQFTIDDIPFAQRIRAIAGWNQTDADWLRLLRYQPDGCFVIECDGQPAGTATTTCYGEELAWIGMVLVDPRFRRRGLATALMEHCLGYLLEEKRIRCVRLDATPDGQQVYEKIGFAAEYQLARWKGTSDLELDGMISKPAVDFENVAELDHNAFGADRIAYLDQLKHNSRISITQNGYGMIRPGEIANYLGPVVAETESAGKALIKNLLAHPPGDGPIFWDIPETNSGARCFAKELHFQKQRDLIRMWTGTEPVADQPNLQWAIGSPETG